MVKIISSKLQRDERRHKFKLVISICNQLGNVSAVRATLRGLKLSYTDSTALYCLCGNCAPCLHMETIYTLA